MKKFILLFSLFLLAIDVEKVCAMDSIKTITVTIKKVGVNGVKVEVNDNTTIADLKRKIEPLTMLSPDGESTIPVDIQRLVYAGQELKDDEKSLKDCRIQDGESIYLVPRSHPTTTAAKVATAINTAFDEGKAGRARGNPKSFTERINANLQKAFPSTYLKKHPKIVDISVTAVKLSVLVAAVAGVMKVRAYKRMKKQLIKKYDLGKLTDLQNKVWMATVLASYGMPWYLHSLVKESDSLAQLVGADPRAVAELYYGHVPTEGELDVFLVKFFAGKK